MRRIALACAVLAPVAGLVLGSQEPTYDDVGPIIVRSCTPCHSPGGPAPFNLRTYDESKRRADRVGVNVASMAMPPCQITSDFGAFSSVPGLSLEEVVALRRWATSGAQRGVEPEPQAKPVEFSWRLGVPHLVLKSGPLTAPAEGGVHLVFAKIALPRGGKLRGLQIRPRDPRTVRQALVGWAPAGVGSPTGQTTFASGVRLMGASAFGYYTWRLPKNAVVDVPPKSELHIMVQCHAIGRPGDASFELGLYFADKAEAHAQSLVLEQRDFTIEVGEKPTLTAGKVLPARARITALFPEFLYACERVRLDANLPDGQTKTLLSGRWDVYWTGAYNFIDPPVLPAGTVLKLSAYYNNGFEASHGPDVRVPIKQGTGPNDELFKMTVQYVPMD